MKIDHKNTKCCICGSSETHIKPNGEPFWTRHKDRGIWDRKSYECYKCHYNIGKIHKPRTPKDFFEGRICCICGTDTVNIDNSGTPHWYRCLCSKDKCTGYVCQKCYDRYNPNSSHGKIKLIADCRTGQLNMYSKTGKGILITAVVAKVRKLDVLDIKLDYLRNNVDLSDDFEYNAIEVKMATLNYANMWSFSTEREQWYDNIFLVCMDKHQPWKTIEEIYIIPSDVAYKVKSITIYKGSQRSIYSTFKIDPKPYNDAYHSLMEFLKDKKYLCIEDIKKWLNDGK